MGRVTSIGLALLALAGCGGDEDPTPTAPAVGVTTDQAEVDGTSAVFALDKIPKCNELPLDEVQDAVEDLVAFARATPDETIPQLDMTFREALADAAGQLKLSDCPRDLQIIADSGLDALP